jgi:HK97 family phage portal protein
MGQTYCSHEFRSGDPAENPAIPLAAIGEGDGMYDILCGPPTTSGTRVSRHKVLGLSAVWKGVNLISGDVGRHPFRVYKQVGSGFEVDRNHQAARVMRKPNDYMTPFTFRQTLTAHALLSGNGYAFISRTIDGVPLELLPLHPDETWPVRVDGELWYVTKTQHGQRRDSFVKIPSTDMLHIRGLGFDGLVGYPVTRILRDTFGAAIASRDYGSRYFKNDGSPGLVLEVPAGMKDSAVNNLRNTWSEMHEGLDKAHRPAILRDGVKLVPFLKASAKDAQLIDNRGFDIIEVANILSIPAHKLGAPTVIGYNSLESEDQAYSEETLDRWFVSWEQESEMKLLTESEKEFGIHCCKFDKQKYQSVRLAELGAYFSQALQCGWLNPDEVRGLVNMQPVPNGKGKEFKTPANTVPA